MKIQHLFFLLCLTFSACTKEDLPPDPEQEPEEFNCREFWESFSLEEFCGLDIIEHHLGSEGDELCGFQIHPFNESWTHEDHFLISVFEANDLEESIFTHSIQRSNFESHEGYSQTTDVGDEGFRVEYNDPNESYDLVYHFRKGNILIDLLFSNLDCFTAEKVHEMAQKIADNL